MKIATKILKSHALFLALFLIMPFLLHPAEVYSADCSISGPGNPSGIVGTPMSFNFTGSHTNGSSQMRVNFVWVASTVPGMSSVNNPAEGTAKSILYTFSGTPTLAGTYNYTATAHDDNAKCTDFSTIGSVTIANPPTVKIDTNSLPNGQVGLAYNKTVVASGGVTPYNWTNSGFPAGLILNVVANDLVISGTPNAGTDGTYSVVVTVTDSVANVATETYTLTILPAIAPLDIATMFIPDGTIGIPYSYAMTGTGGTPPYSWTAAGLPGPLTMDSAGVITGTPSAIGLVNTTITITDSKFVVKSKIYPFNINAVAAVATSSMSDYCVTPPFISPAPKPNLILMIDNSASMYDLFYVDKGSAARTSYYCYDNTFNSATDYPGYFNEASIYKFNTLNYRFEISAFPGVCNKQVPSIGAAAHLCINGVSLNIGDPTPRSVSEFYASGKYLNWLTSSKFDIEKQVLTGGKYDPGFQSLIAESRGCVGRRYVKEALTADYVEGGANTSLGITFGVRGPIDPSNPSAASTGGLTNIDIFVGNYDEGACQTAIDAYSEASCNQQCRRDATTACLKYDSKDTTLAGKASNTYIQSVQECYQYDQNGTVGDPDAANTVKNQCPAILDHYAPGNCSVTIATVCDIDADCPGVERCIVGPYAITAGNAALLCGSAYTGACYVGAAPYSKFGYTGTVDGYTGDACVIYMHNKYCGDIKQPPVVDPTDDVSATEFYENVPAILGDVGLQSQLGDPIKMLEVRVQNVSPTGIIHDFKDRIRFGAISFDFNGSPSECGKGVCSHDPLIACTSDAMCGGTYRCLILTPCPKICSNNKSKTCMSFQDCPPASPAPTCDLVTAGNLYKDPVTGVDVQNQDGARVISYIGDPLYVSNPIGDHTSGLINALDSIRAQTWTPHAEGFYNAVAYYTQNTADATRPARLNSNDFNTTTDPIQNNCQENNILLISDGMSTTDQKSTVMSFVSTYNDDDGQITITPSTSGSEAPKYFGSRNVDDLAWYAQNKNIFDPASTAAKKPKETIKTYVAYTGELCDQTSTSILCDTCPTNDESKPERLMYQTALNGGGTCNFAKDMPKLEEAIAKIFEEVAGAAASGTAASVLASGEGSGANLVQAVFYPIKKFSGTDIKWIGRLSNLWYYVDPLFSSSGIYEDNSGNPGPPYSSPNDYVLNLTNDNRVSFAYDPVDKVTKAQRSKDTDNDGVVDKLIAEDIEFEDMASLWDAGVELWKRSTARTIKTTIGGGLIDFSIANAAVLRPYLQASNVTEAENIINYIHGTGDYGYRNRTVKVDLNKDGDVLDADETVAKVWRLGDIIQSTPRIASRFALNSYDKVYNDTTYGEFIGETSPATVNYRSRGVVYAGANDGMMHAFYLGKLELDGAWNVDPNKLYKKASLTDPSNVGRGKELWSFIPKNVLPYLKHIADPNYCHIYSVDLSPYVFDASIGAPGSGDISNNVKDVNSWRTILIGGMRIGGACRKSDAACTDCVKAPGVDLDGGGVTTDEEKSLGLSTYFALDITNSLNDPADPPQLLWEFSDPSLGFTSTGTSIVKINMKSVDSNGDGNWDGLDPSVTLRNGKWFVVFGSGPTGPISTADQQFLGKSDQNLKLFIIDLKNGPVAGSIWTKTTAEQYSFAGSMINSTFDVDTDYQDDVVYVPYVKRENSGTVLDPSYTWTAGGVGRLLTKEDLDPTNWTWSKVYEGIGPVTSAVAKLQDKRRKQLWLYFGSGRYYFEQEPADDREGQQAIYGIKDPCYDFNSHPNFNLAGCPALGALTDVTEIGNVPTDYTTINAMNGWFIDLNSCSDSAGVALGDDPVTDCADPSVAYRTERMITDPLATTLGVIFYTTFKPKDDSCEPGGKSYIWATKYNTGGAGGGLLKGKAILQVSTGKIEEIDLASQFSEEGGRRSSGMEGVPPTAQGLSLITSPPPVKRTIHMRER